mmetsp:Transcript_36526/g.117106  ORF Transcript_36526/g.117106 Transcript_36526/m.117106 type:complete len:179 (+) Transcript_36526:23-559(+)
MPDDAPGVLVTVGTTSFDALVAAAATREFAERLEESGYEWLRIQVGRGAAPPAGWDGEKPLERSWFRFTADMPGEMSRASLVVSHGGAGSIMEALTLKKRLVVCVNEELMGNHQAELALELRDRKHLILAKPHDIADAVVAATKATTLEPYPDFDASLFPTLVDDEMRLHRHFRCCLL